MIPSDVVAARVKELRRRRGWSAQELANRCVELGAPKVTAATIANIETGRMKDDRRTRMLTVDELLVFALALDVPPLLLLMPEGGALDVTPDKAMRDPMAVATWVSGIKAPGVPKVFYENQAARIRAFYAVHDAIAAAKAADFTATRARGTETEKVTSEQRDVALERLALRLEPVLREGVIPGNLPLPWINEMVGRGWLQADAVPAAELEQLENEVMKEDEDG